MKRIMRRWILADSFDVGDVSLDSEDAGGRIARECYETTKDGDESDDSGDGEDQAPAVTNNVAGVNAGTTQAIGE